MSAMLEMVAETPMMRKCATGSWATTGLRERIFIRAITASSVGPRPSSPRMWISSTSSSATRLMTLCASRRKRVKESHFSGVVRIKPAPRVCSSAARSESPVSSQMRKLVAASLDFQS